MALSLSLFLAPDTLIEDHVLSTTIEAAAGKDGIVMYADHTGLSLCLMGLQGSMEMYRQRGKVRFFFSVTHFALHSNASLFLPNDIW